MNKFMNKLKKEYQQQGYKFLCFGTGCNSYELNKTVSEKHNINDRYIKRIQGNFVGTSVIDDKEIGIYNWLFVTT